jgi:hypothetical protein
MENDRLHPGITMHKLPVGAGFAGVVFTVGSMVIFLVALPTLWYFLAGAVALGVGIASVLRFTEHQKETSHTP